MEIGVMAWYSNDYTSLSTEVVRVKCAGWVKGTYGRVTGGGYHQAGVNVSLTTEIIPFN